MPPNFVLPVTMLEAMPSSVPITAEAVGQTEGAKEVEIRPRVGGILLKRKYNEGSAVKAGQTLFVIDPEPYKIALNQARAQYNQNLARAEQTKREKKRLEGLIESQSISQREFDNAVSDESINLAALAQSRANLKQAELNLTLLKLYYQNGKKLPGDPVLSLNKMLSLIKNQKINCTQTDIRNFVVYCTELDIIKEVRARKKEYQVDYAAAKTLIENELVL
jgi:multidrug efflux pump subunit AcrA (membrane-fusion protein)